MGSKIDPYRKWLGIKSDMRPPNHYDLLGLDQFENRKDVIAAASIERTDLLQDIASGNEHVELSQRILNEVAAARLCLLDTEQRKRYELFIKKQSAGLGVAEDRLSKAAHANRTADTADLRESNSDEKGSVGGAALASMPDEVSKPRPPTIKTTRAKAGNRWLIPAAIGILVFAVVASVAIAAVIVMNAGETSASDADSSAAVVAKVAKNSGIAKTDKAKTNKAKRAAKKKRNKQSRKGGADDPGSDAGNEVDANESISPAAIPSAASPKPENVLVSYDASEGKPRSLGQIQSPELQGWVVLDGSQEKTQAVMGKYSKPAWKAVADESEIGVGAEHVLSDAELETMWNRGWRMEVIARIEKGTGQIGFGFPRTSAPFVGKKESQILLVYSAVKGDYRIQQGWQDEQLTIKNGINSRRFTKVVLETPAKSYEMKMTVAQLSGKLDKEGDVKELLKPFTVASPFTRKIGWLVRSAKNDSTLKASLIVRKIQL